jgi:hypothetical protein
MDLSSDKPVFSALVVLIVAVVTIAGAVITITHPDTLPFHEYIQNVSIMAGALGLGAGIGRGIETYGNAIAGKNDTTTPPSE